MIIFLNALQVSDLTSPGQQQRKPQAPPPTTTGPSAGAVTINQSANRAAAFPEPKPRRAPSSQQVSVYHVEVLYCALQVTCHKQV